jgi:ArsR family transcriptional regulator
MQQVFDILAACAEPTRLAALKILWDGEERCVCELMDTLGKSQSCMSRHMTTLKRAGLVVDRREAQWVRYRRNPSLPREAATLVKAIFALEGTPRKPS